jgi:hypothetical protein
MVSQSPNASPYLAEFNFAVDKSTPGAFEFPDVSCLPSGQRLHLAPFKVPVHDLRQQKRRPSLDVEGFTWLSLPYKDLNGPEGTWEEQYKIFICQ